MSLRTTYAYEICVDVYNSAPTFSVGCLRSFSVAWTPVNLTNTYTSEMLCRSLSGTSRATSFTPDTATQNDVSSLAVRDSVYFIVYFYLPVTRI